MTVQHCIWRKVAGTVLTAAFLVSSANWGAKVLANDQPNKVPVSEAIALFRALKPVSDADRAALRVDPKERAAWQSLLDSGADGLAAVRKEITQLEPAGGKDDVFRIISGSLLWHLGGVDAVPEIVSLWNDPKLNLSLTPVIVHITAYQAARTRDEKVLPLLFASFREVGGVVQFPRGSISLTWPETSEFAWAAYGPKGREALTDLLNTSKDEKQIATATWLLARDAFAPALGAITRIAESGDGIAKQTAIRALGIFGYPKSYDFLAKSLTALKGKTDDTAVALVDALTEFGDLRAVPVLRDYLRSLDDASRKSAIGQRIRLLMTNLVDPASIALLRDEAKKQTGVERANLDATIANLFASIGIPANEYDQMTAEDQDAALTKYRNRQQEAYLPTDDKTLPKLDFTAIIDRIRTEGRLPFGEITASGKELLPRDLIAIAKTTDIDSLLEARVSIAQQLTPEALSEMDIISAMAARITRATYRQDVGITMQVKGK